MLTPSGPRLTGLLLPQRVLLSFDGAEALPFRGRARLAAGRQIAQPESFGAVTLGSVSDLNIRAANLIGTR